ncbi:MAG: hypothetical protein WC280_01275 [Patescibacteria group bacterium]
MSGYLLKPGFHLSDDDRGDKSEDEWDAIVRYRGITDERGPYLPLYSSDVVLKLCNNYITEKKEKMLGYLAIEKGWT